MSNVSRKGATGLAAMALTVMALAGCSTADKDSSAPAVPPPPTPEAQPTSSTVPPSPPKPPTSTPKPSGTAGNPTAPAIRSQEIPSVLPGGAEAWKLVWSDEFDGTDPELDTRWSAQNGPNPHILCSRWRKNVRMDRGELTITNRKESRGGQEWTSGSISSKKTFTYGYFECRYRYAAAPATNNSFWLMSSTPAAGKGKRFEIDINEGHYPNEIATNIHNWSDFYEEGGKRRHPTSSKSFRIGAREDFSTTLETPVTTRGVRLVGRGESVIHLREARILPPGITPQEAAAAGRDAGPAAKNLLKTAGVTVDASGSINGKTGASLQGEARKAFDDKLESEWTSQRKGEKWIEFHFPEPRQIGAVQLLSGYRKDGSFVGILDDFILQYEKDGAWVPLSASTPGTGEHDLSSTFHLYGLEWTPNELVFYHDGKELRRERNEFCHSPSPVILSLAIIAWGGPITDKLDGSSMVVDFVRVYQRPNTP